jgi:drug/metabolite transporter (DMT)-like permease
VGFNNGQSYKSLSVFVLPIPSHFFFLLSLLLSSRLSSLLSSSPLLSLLAFALLVKKETPHPIPKIIGLWKEN